MLRGNCLVAQSGGPTSVINGSLYGVITQALKENSFGKILGGIHGIKGILEGKIKDLTEVSMDLLEKVKLSPSAALGSCRYKLKDPRESTEEYEKLFKVFDENNVRYFFYIGGNDSMDSAYKIDMYAKKVGYDIKVIGIPKTIDNDLMHTDHCPGYGSVAKYVATVCMELALDSAVYGTGVINVLEVMGRNTGWIAGSAALAKEKIPDLNMLIYMPEIVFDEEKFLNDLKKAFETNNHLFVVVSEGLVNKDGDYVFNRKNSYKKDIFGHIQLGGVGDYIEQLIKANVYDKVKLTRLGFLQRCAMHYVSKTDLDEAVMAGEMAIKYALEGISGKMVTLVREDGPDYRCSTGLVELDKVCNYEKKVPLEWINEDGNFVNNDFMDYVRPLVVGEAEVPMHNGLPVYTRLF
ncbi:6-phosphofructokinase [Caldanaerobius fijiensis DSM 17918]|uniref:Pyrophosphate--fructose 6-phosphate 1-phosphotransferase n=1 Tax=Caldanaerobius fijiensis DSM 17918 TaxID=1121256 RepID=A0A1M5DI44_9THEO|nr:6-phosphofructokinase [Caldanaerobius fijiensis]SHF66541.1 6-phosphofructokinase [Caldanaerobius fijiensis DSM 17918]